MIGRLRGYAWQEIAGFCGVAAAIGGFFLRQEFLRLDSVEGRGTLLCDQLLNQPNPPPQLDFAPNFSFCSQPSSKHRLDLLVRILRDRSSVNVVIGLGRSGKTTFILQALSERPVFKLDPNDPAHTPWTPVGAGPCLMFVSSDDDPRETAAEKIKEKLSQLVIEKATPSTPRHLSMFGLSLQPLPLHHSYNVLEVAARKLTERGLKLVICVDDVQLWVKVGGGKLLGDLHSLVPHALFLGISSPVRDIGLFKNYPHWGDRFGLLFWEPYSEAELTPFDDACRTFFRQPPLVDVDRKTLSLVGGNLTDRRAILSGASIQDGVKKLGETLRVKIDRLSHEERAALAVVAKHSSGVPETQISPNYDPYQSCIGKNLVYYKDLNLGRVLLPASPLVAQVATLPASK